MIGGRLILFYRQSYIKEFTEIGKRETLTLSQSPGFPLHTKRLRRRLRVIILHELGYLCKGLSFKNIKWMP